MKKIFFFFFPVLIAILFISCGPSAGEKATLKKLHADSLYHTQAIMNQCDSVIRQAKLQLEVENSRMTSIKDFQFLKTAAQKDEQIKNQRKRIMEFEEYISDVA